MAVGSNPILFIHINISFDMPSLDIQVLANRKYFWNKKAVICCLNIKSWVFQICLWNFISKFPHNLKKARDFRFLSWLEISATIPRKLKTTPVWFILRHGAHCDLLGLQAVNCLTWIKIYMHDIVINRIKHQSLLNNITIHNLRLKRKAKRSLSAAVQSRNKYLFQSASYCAALIVCKKNAPKNVTHFSVRGS